MLDSELFMLGEIRGTFVSDGDLGPARLEWHIPAHGSRKRFGCGMLGHTSP